MKKIVATSLSILALIGYSYCQTTNEVSSVNAVGYMKIVVPAKPGLCLGGVNLIAVNGTDHIGLKEFFGTNQLRQSVNAGSGDAIKLWDSASQTYISYQQKTNASGVVDFYNLSNWLGEPTNPIVSNGTAYWIKSMTTAQKEIFVMGGVPVDESVNNTISTGSGRPLNFIANPYPVKVLLDDLINTNDGAKASSSLGSADWIKMWDQSSQLYVNYGLRSNGTEAAYWSRMTNDWSPKSNVWLEAGQGVWYTSRKATPILWTENKPYAWPN